MAKKLLSDAGKGMSPSWEIRHVPQEVARFAAELLGLAKGGEADQLLAWARKDPVGILGKNSVWVASLASCALPAEVVAAFQMDSNLLQSAVAFQSGKVEEGHIFEEFLYRRALTRVRNFLAREVVLDGEHERDIVHDEFLSIVAMLRSKPPHTLAEIDWVVAAKIEWAHIGRLSRTAARRREISFSDLEDLWGGLWHPWSEGDQDRSLLVQEILSFVGKIDMMAAEVLAQYYLEGWTLLEIAKAKRTSTHTVKMKLVQATILAQKLVHKSAEKASPA